MRGYGSVLRHLKIFKLKCFSLKSAKLYVNLSHMQVTITAANL